jgi:hypothetical protein
VPQTFTYCRAELVVGDASDGNDRLPKLIRGVKFAEGLEVVTGTANQGHGSDWRCIYCFSLMTTTTG